MLTNFGVEPCYESAHLAAMLTKAQLLSQLEAKAKAREIKYAHMGAVLGLTSSRVAEIFRAIRKTDKKPRELTYDEGVKLLEAFLSGDAPPEPSQAAQVPPVSMLRLAVLHIARILGTEPSEEQVARAAKDLQAFLRFAATRKAVDLAEAAAAFDALLLRQEGSEEEAQPKTDPEHAR